MINKLIKKKHKGVMGILFSMCSILFILAVMLYVLQYKINTVISQHIEDSISMSTLGVLLPDLDINAVTKNAVMNDPAEKYAVFKEMLGTNLAVDTDFGENDYATKSNKFYRADGEGDNNIYVENFTIYNIHNAVYKEDSSMLGFADIDVYSYGHNALKMSDLQSMAPGCTVVVRDSKYKDNGYIGTVVGCRYDYSITSEYFNYKSSGVGLLEYAKLLKSKGQYSGADKESYLNDIKVLKGLVSPEGVPITSSGIYTNITVPVKQFDMNFFNDGRKLFVYARKEQTTLLRPEVKQALYDFTTL